MNHDHSHLHTDHAHEPLAKGINWDSLGIGLSTLCAIHCAVTPLALASMPLVAQPLLDHPLFHVLMAVLILPVGLWAFVSGYRHHHQARVLWLGVPGLLIVCLIPPIFHGLGMEDYETPFMILGSLLLISSHWINRRACKHCEAN